MYRVAILGCENSHADAFLEAVIEKKIVEDIEFVGVYSDDTEAAQKLSDRFGVKVAKNYDEFVGEIDGLIVTARHGDNHYKYAKPYIESGIPMFIDKPITHSVEDAKEFMAALKANNVPVSGGSMVVLSENVKALKAAMAAKENGNVIGGFVREPINKTNIYGGISFYSQHGVQTMMELFGMNPRSVQVFEKGIALTCVVRYDDFDVVLSFADLKFSVYYAGISFEDKFEATDISLDGCAEAEFMEFYDVLKTRKQKKSYEEFFAPVYVIDAITRAVESGKEEPIVKYEV